MKILEFVVLLSVFLASSVTGQFFFNCDDNPCQNGGTCIDLYRKTAYRCECLIGWDGENCDNPLNNQVINPDEHNQIDTDNDISKDEGPEIIPDYKKPENPCGKACKNHGYCDEVKKKCECPARYHGEFCQYSSSSSMTYDNYEACEESCVREDTKIGENCNYNEADSLKACKCGRFKVNKDHGKCMPILKSHDACKKDCELNTDFSKNETRTCNYYIKNIVNGCSCVETAQGCEKQELRKLPENVRKEWFSYVKFGPLVFVAVCIYLAVTKLKPIIQQKMQMRSQEPPQLTGDPLEAVIYNKVETSPDDDEEISNRIIPEDQISKSSSTATLR